MQSLERSRVDRAISARERLRYRLQQWLPAVAALLSALVALALTWNVYSNALAKQHSDARDDVNEHLQRVRLLLDRELQTSLSIPETIAAFVTGVGDIQRDVFYSVAARLIEKNRHVRNIALAPDNVINAVYPRSGNEPSLGLRYLEHPTQGEAVRQAMASRRTVVAGPIALVQGGNGIVSRTPVFVGNGDDARYWGIISLALNADTVFASIGLGVTTHDIAVAARFVDSSGKPGTVFAGNAAVFTQAPVLLKYSLPGGGNWELAAIPETGWASSMQRTPEFVILAALFTLAIGVLSHRLVASNQRIRTLAVQDPLTQLPNRRLFEDRIEQAMSAARRHGRRGALLLLDLDRFKAVNDNYGHGAGDEVLIAVAARLKSCLRTTDSVARLGGDEFAIVMPEIASDAEIEQMGAEVCATIAQPIPLARGMAVSIGASVGHAAFDHKTPDLLTLFDRADRAMYLQKISHRRAQSGAVRDA